ncbi:MULTISPECIES: hypothetical protein [Streptomyces]|uniref:hypothetical protein n=1 Tax=Streptomyces TaxID=1883 RepID=UPI0022488B6A|nr:hypothetical protein [Streptomyces sp. JHD 1]MCX2968210.1 hypothetical protein [Streptomyces sp. JHD 1]
MSGRHAASGRDRVGAVAALVWGTGHLAAIALLGSVVHDQAGAAPATEVVAGGGPEEEDRPERQ